MRRCSRRLYDLTRVSVAFHRRRQHGGPLGLAWASIVGLKGSSIRPIEPLLADSAAGLSAACHHLAGIGEVRNDIDHCACLLPARHLRPGGRAFHLGRPYPRLRYCSRSRRRYSFACDCSRAYAEILTGVRIAIGAGCRPWSPPSWLPAPAGLGFMTLSRPSSWSPMWSSSAFSHCAFASAPSSPSRAERWLTPWKAGSNPAPPPQNDNGESRWNCSVPATAGDGRYLGTGIWRREISGLSETDRGSPPMSCGYAGMLAAHRAVRGFWILAAALLPQTHRLRFSWPYARDCRRNRWPPGCRNPRSRVGRTPVDHVVTGSDPVELAGDGISWS